MIDSHPEEALEQAIAGTLLPDERERLEQHLAVCVACKVHLVLASAGQEGLRARARDDAADRVNVELAMAALALVSKPSPLRSRSLAKRVLWLSAAALLAMGGIAAAAYVHTARTRQHSESNSVVSGDTFPRPAPLPKMAEVAPLADEAPSAEASQLMAESAPVPFANPNSREGAAGALQGSTTTLPGSPVTANALFRKASALRAEGASEAAISVFLKLQKQFPSSRESQVSLMIAGRLLLDRGRPAEALDEFDRYLSEGGSVSEHALAGRASALQGLGRSDAEASAWQRLLTAYPQSVYTQRATTRLSQLRPTQPAPKGSASAP